MAALWPDLGYIALGLAGSSDPTHPIEVAGGSYVRIPTDFVALADGSGNAANLETLQWPVATSRWGSVGYVQVWDSPTGGTLIATAALAAPVFVDLYDIAHIPAAGLLLVDTIVPRGFGTAGFGTLGFGSGAHVPVLTAELLLAFDEATGIACEAGTWGPGIQCKNVLGSPYSRRAYSMGPYSTMPYTSWLTAGNGVSCESGTWAPGPVLAGNPPANAELLP